MHMHNWLDKLARTVSSIPAASIELTVRANFRRAQTVTVLKKLYDVHIFLFIEAQQDFGMAVTSPT